MPPAALIGVAEFVEETRDDYNSPTTSTFASRMPDCRQTMAVLEEVRDLSYWKSMIFINTLNLLTNRRICFNCQSNHLSYIYLNIIKIFLLLYLKI